TLCPVPGSGCEVIVRSMEQLPLWDAPPTAPPRRSIPLLSKSRFGAGLQCHKRLYLDLYAPKELAERWDPMTRALFETGKKVGLVARDRFRGGVAVNDDYRQHDEAVRETAAALKAPDTPAIYEAAFTHDDVRVRVDILAAAGNGEWDLIEVKSSSGYREDYLSEIAIQLYVVEGAGVRVRRACLLHVNSQYVFEGMPYDLERLFSLREVTT